MIEINNVSMQYPKPRPYKDLILKPFKQNTFTALRNLNIAFQAGDRAALLGANGAGKTTLLKLVGGLIHPTEGNITINNYDTVKQNLKSRYKVGFVINEERSFYWQLSAKENLRFFGSLENIFGKELKNKIDELLELVELKEFENTLFSSFSSGMKQRLAIARGLITDPEILILDEPTRTLDPVSTEKVKNLIEHQIHEDKTRTLLIATHSMEEAKSLCNRVCILKNGILVHDESMENTIQEYNDLSSCYNNFFN